MNEIFEKNSDFGKWLESNYWFQDGHLLDYKFDGDRDVIYLKLGYQISGTNEANTTRILRVFSLKAEGIFSFTALQEDEWSRDHCMEGIDLKNSNSIIFTLDVPKPIEIACAKVIREFFKSRLSDVAALPAINGSEILISIVNISTPLTPSYFTCAANKPSQTLRIVAASNRNFSHQTEKTKCDQSTPI